MTSSLPKTTELKGGRYSLLRRLGEGAQGETYEGRDNTQAKPRPSGDLVTDFREYVRRARDGDPKTRPGLLAIKCFRIGNAKTWKEVELAEREARTLASLEHPALPRYVEHFEEDGALYLVMEKIEGETLSSLRARRVRMRAEEVVRMLEDIGDALRYLHGRTPPIVHRDVKPGNILRRPDGSYALVDFGAVKDGLEPRGGSTVVGTFGYMAPEQFQGRASPKSDVYGLGATALTMLTGIEPEDLPHRGLAIDVSRAASGAGALGRALAAMLNPHPEERAEIHDALDEIRQQPRSSKKKAKKERKSKKGRRREERRREEREARRRRRAGTRSGRRRTRPYWLGVWVGQFLAWLVLGVLAPFVLSRMAIPFGESLGKIARSSRTTARAKREGMRRAASRLSEGEADEDLAHGVRVDESDAHVRVAAAAEGEREDRGDDHDRDDDEETSSDSPLRRVRPK